MGEGAAGEAVCDKVGEGRPVNCVLFHAEVLVLMGKLEALRASCSLAARMAAVRSVGKLAVVLDEDLDRSFESAAMAGSLGCSKGMIPVIRCNDVRDAYGDLLFISLLFPTGQTEPFITACS